MDTVRVTCPHCGYHRDVSETRVPATPVRVTCPACKNVFSLGGQPGDADGRPAGGITEAPPPVAEGVNAAAGKFSPLSVFFGWVIVIAIVSCLAVVIGMGYILFVIAIFFLVVARSYGDGEFVASEGLLRLGWAVVYGCGLLAPALGAAFAVRTYLYPDLPVAFPLYDYRGPAGLGWALVIAGGTGLPLGIGAATFGSVWRSRQARQLENIPTSRTRSAAIGLSEFKGVARIPGERTEEDAGRDIDVRKPFYLEDETGRILVDPRGAETRSPATYLYMRVSELCLTGGVLKDGDPLYVIGYVRPRHADPDDVSPGPSGTDALVVGALVERASFGGIMRDLLGATPAMLQRDYQHVFFVSNTSEDSARRSILRGVRYTLVTGTLWAALACWLLYNGVPLVTDRSYDGYTAAEVMRFAPAWRRDAVIWGRIFGEGGPVRDDALDQVPNLKSGPDRSLLPAVLRGAESRDPLVRMYAAKALGAFSDMPEVAVPALARMLGDGNPNAAKAALDAFFALEPRAVELGRSYSISELEPYKDNLRLLLNIFSYMHLKPGFQEALYRELMKAEDPAVRRDAAAMLGERTSPDAVGKVAPILSEARGDADPEVRKAAASSLVRLSFRHKQVIPLVADCLGDPDPEVVKNALNALRVAGPDAGQAVPKIVPLFASPDSDTRFMAAAALGEIGPAATGSVEALERLARDDPDHRVRGVAADSARRIRYSRAGAAKRQTPPVQGARQGE
ncbi:MAG: zinc-ribbon domain-containing protein [Nitrospirae bacterium]|nr:zinc-ribbon domain-containing protein [Nitrospirota bacterium]